MISVTAVMMSSSIRRVFAFSSTRHVNADIVLVGGFVELVFALLQPTYTTGIRLDMTCKMYIRISM